MTFSCFETEHLVSGQVETQVNSALGHINVTLVTACESQIESLLQVSLQLYIYFGGAKVEKRQFSELQLFAINTSILMIVGNQVKNTFVRRSPGESLLEDFKRMIKSSLVSVGIIATFIFSVLMSSKAFFSFNSCHLDVIPTRESSHIGRFYFLSSRIGLAAVVERILY